MKKWHSLLFVFVVGLAVLGAGVLVFGGESEPDRPAIYESTVASLDDEQAAAFEAALTDEDGELTEQGSAFLERLELVERVGVEQRTAVGTSVASDGLHHETIHLLDGVLNSTAESQASILERGLTDTSGDGLLDGEAHLLGLDPATPHPTVATAATSLRGTGYDATDIAYLEQVSRLQNQTIQSQQATGLGLVPSATLNGSATEMDRWKLDDAAGDGLINGLTESMGLNTSEQHPRIAEFATTLAAGGYDAIEIEYLHQIATINDSEAHWEQASYLGLLAGTVDERAVTSVTIQALDVRSDGLLDGFATQLELGAETRNESVEALASQLAPTGYTDIEIEFLRQAGVVSENSVSFEQARALGLLEGAIENETVASGDVEALTDTAGDGLLNGMATQLGLDPGDSHSLVAEYATPLAQGGYNESDLTYLARIDDLAEYQDSEYEIWAQAEQLELLDAAVANGSVTSNQAWGIGNDADNRLLNAMEVEFGTDPARADTSGDGYPDHLAWGPMRDLGLNVTAGEVDVFLELDTVDGQDEPTAEQREMLTETFETEPGEDIGPINLHIRECAGDRTNIDTVDEMQSAVEEYRDITGLGFHYMLITDGTVETEDSAAPGLAYISQSNPSWMIVDGTLRDRGDEAIEASVIAHELGHSLGILGDDFEGVDSREFSESEYESVMNYNYWTPLTFSTGAPFDDYAEMADSEFGSYHQDRSKLAAYWEDGEVAEGSLC